MTDGVQLLLEISDDLLQRDTVCSELKCCYPSLKWEVPVSKSSTGDMFRPFLKGLRIDKVRTSGRRLGPPEKVFHVFPLMEYSSPSHGK